MKPKKLASTSTSHSTLYRTPLNDTRAVVNGTLGNTVLHLQFTAKGVPHFKCPKDTGECLQPHTCIRLLCGKLYFGQTIGSYVYVVVQRKIFISCTMLGGTYSHWQRLEVECRPISFPHLWFFALETLSTCQSIDTVLILTVWWLQRDRVERLLNDDNLRGSVGIIWTTCRVEDLSSFTSLHVFTSHQYLASYCDSSPLPYIDTATHLFSLRRFSQQEDTLSITVSCRVSK